MKDLLWIILLLAIIFSVGLFGFGMNAFFAPKYRALENKVFKESEQYNDGMVRDFENLRLEYLKAKDVDSKKVIALTIKHRFSVYLDKLNYDQKQFYNSL